MPHTKTYKLHQIFVFWIGTLQLLLSSFLLKKLEVRTDLLIHLSW